MKMNDSSRQESMVRQTNLRLVTDYLRQINLNLGLKDIAGICNVMTDYCVKGYTKDIAGRLEAIDNFIKSKFDEQ